MSGTFKRRLIQLYAALLYNAHLRGFVTGRIYTGAAKALCVPGLNCYSCPAAAGACPLGSLQHALSSAKKSTVFYIAGILMLYGLIFGRTICGWLCPMGLIQELLHKVPSPKIGKNHITRGLTLLKYLILTILVIAIPLWFGVRTGLAEPAFCKYLCPAGTLEGAGGLLLHPANRELLRLPGAIFAGKVLAAVLILIACLFIFRPFCRFLCPLGAIYSLFHDLAVVGIRVEPDRCNGCGACISHCRMDIRRVGDRECIQCGECIGVCSQEAIRVKAGKITVISPGETAEGREETAGSTSRSKHYATRIAAVLLLVLILLWFSFLDPSVRNHRNEPEFPEAFHVSETADKDESLASS